MQNLITLSIFAMIILLPMPLIPADKFPWWYHYILSRHMPPWMISILEQPELAIGCITTLFAISLIIILILMVKLRHARRALTHLRAQYALLELQHSQMPSSMASKSVSSDIRERK